MQSTEEKLAKSLTADSKDLIPFLPYLLQDLWELGSSPKYIVDMIGQNIHVTKQTKVIDLACGKGAISINISAQLGCTVKGIDIIPEFIDVANQKAHEFGVEENTEFVVGDITESVKTEKDYDIVVFGAVGDVLGNSEETIKLLKNTVKKQGYIIIDDAYAKDTRFPNYLTRDQWLNVFDHLRVRLIDEKINEDNELESLHNEQLELIGRRVEELKVMVPDKSDLFDGYLLSQQAEVDELENDILGVTLLLQVIK